MCIRLLQVYFQFWLFPAKRANHVEGYVNFQDIEHQLQNNILYHCHHYSFSMKS